MIQFINVGKRFAGGNEALSNVSLSIDDGEFVFLTGHSGAGKSTLLRLTALLDRASRGQIIVDGRNLERVQPREVPYYRRRLGVIFQEHHLLPERTAFDNVATPLWVAGIGPNEIRKRVRAALDKVSLLHKEQARAGTLSTGEQQRVGIARAVVNRPSVILADEPTGNLDPTLSREILGLLEQFNNVGVTVIVATHDVDLLGLKPRRTLTLRAGRVVADGVGTAG
ncbi:MAG: cell division ATP-binding protein FtsE [Gammaproteobacteria bacterium]